MNKREELVFMASLAERAERYNEMYDAMKQITLMSIELTSEERNLLSVAYKNVIGNHNITLRNLTGFERTEENKSPKNDQIIKSIKEYKNQIATEHQLNCKEMLQLLDDYLIPNANTSESKVFFYRFKGDVCRNITEWSIDDNDRKKRNEDAFASYSKANELTRKEFSPIDPKRLGLALSYSIFSYEILNMPKVAIEIAETAFNDALSQMDKIDNETNNESLLTMQLLRDNIVLWTSEMEENNDKN